ncbi:CHAP domain-containing protein [Spongisporangium articulatum]|uniref:CHAP domain-containing protein n=1 Tax=Spongisporangium articulatum TaxID=3362603 RepID=A0ABW8AGP3_9ACTN
MGGGTVRRGFAWVSGLVLIVGGTVPLSASATQNLGAAAESPYSIEKMVHYSCDRTARASVAVSWHSATEARVNWKIEKKSGGRKAALKIVGIDYNGSKKAVKRYMFADDHKIVTSGSGSRSGGRLWAPGLGQLDEIEVWVWTLGSTCGPNVIKRLNDTVHTAKRTDPKPYSKSSALRKKIKKVALAQYHGGNHESGENCSKYVNAFYEPNICQAWCSDFAWWVWMKAGVPGAKMYNSSYTNDFRDEWRVRFKPIGGKYKPAVGDVMVQKHRTNGINGHVGVVIAVDGWKVKVVHGNWSDAVQFQGWTDSRKYTSDHGAKKVIGFASPA